MRIKVIADVHGDLDAVCREAASCDVLLLLGDLINVVDYETAGGILGEVYGTDAIREWSVLRAQGRMQESREVLRRASGDQEREKRALFARKVQEAHEWFCERVPANTVVTYGNVDNPGYIRRYLPEAVRFVDGEVVELDGLRFGFVGGGLPKAGVPGEVTLEQYDAKVRSLDKVDVLCAHVPPRIDDLTFDVVANFNEPGSQALLDYIHEYSPSHVYFGHVHQPRVARTRVASTILVNVGQHFRTTGRAVDHPVVG